MTPIDPHDIPARLGHAIRHHRDLARLTQAALAEKIGIGQSRIADVESARTAIRVDVAAEIATALGLPLSELIASAEGPAGQA